MKAIVEHPNYHGMPDAVKPDGKIQWEAPSNRKGGLYKDTHHKRREWWRRKASELGISDKEDKWISRVAKSIHPSGEKPCKRCGRMFQIAYVYPGRNLIRRAERIYGPKLVPEFDEAISDYVSRIVDINDTEALLLLPDLLATALIKLPDLGTDLEAWLYWIDNSYIPLEPSLLSPGAMSNAPDRLDGFHSFNRCCRGEADTGRHADNLRQYCTDRRVFEFWSEGDWIAADRMMGTIHAKYSEYPTADGGEGCATADHIGPLSLGYVHSPEFRLLSRSANSAKNNRITLWDVDYLLRKEKFGAEVVSWYAKSIWDALKHMVKDEETALRLSKIMRDNQRIAMQILFRLLTGGHATFLCALLGLEYADYKVDFQDIEIVDFVTVPGTVLKEARTTKYSAEQKARRVRVGFQALRMYGSKTNRHFYAISDSTMERCIKMAEKALERAPKKVLEMNSHIIEILDHPGTASFEEQLRELCQLLPGIGDIPVFVEAHIFLQEAMQHVGKILAKMWENERYVRAAYSLEE